MSRAKRTLKIESAWRERRPSPTKTTPAPSVPKIRLEGAWLQQAGFSPEGRVEVEISDGVLVIRAAVTPAKEAE